MEEKTERGLRPAVIVTGGDCDTEALAASGAFMDMVRSGYVIAADSGLETADRGTDGISPCSRWALPRERIAPSRRRDAGILCPSL